MMKFNYHVRKTYRGDTPYNVKLYINAAKKQEKCKQGIDFIEQCLKHEKQPDFSRIALAPSHLNENKHFTNNLRNAITEEELKNKRKKRNRLNNQLLQLQAKISPELSSTDWYYLQLLVHERVSNINSALTTNHTQKLSKLGINPKIRINTNNIDMSRNNISKIEAIDSVPTIFNYSKRELSELETNILKKGLKFGITNRKVDEYEILARFEELAETLDKLEIAYKEDDLKANLNSKNSFLLELQQLSTEFIELSKHAKDNLSIEEHNALVNLSKDKTIVITKADKGNAVVIQDITDYRAKIMTLLNNSGKFKMLEDDETKLRETKLQNYINYLHAKEYHVTKTVRGQRITTTVTKSHNISKQVHDRIQPCGSKSGTMYGLLKIHKPDKPIRPIISSIGTYNYKLAKYLVEILKHLVADNNHILTDTFDFVNKVSSINPEHDPFMISFDVESLFTNIPTTETIEMILDLVYTKGVELFHDLARDELNKLLVICTQESHFQFNGQFYDQIDGVAMGSPLGPLFANIFMSHIEKNHMSKLRELGVNIWLRYVDDIFATLQNKKQAHAILAFLNSLHPQLKFTTESETNKTLSFLDTTVRRDIGKYSTTVYHKKTFTGVYLNWFSLTAKRYKIGLIKGLLSRICKICSTNEDRDLEIEKLKHVLDLNDYPADVVNKVVKDFLDYKDKPKEIEFGPEKKKVFIVLPYASTKCEEFAKKMESLVNRNFNQVDFNVAFQAPKTIGSCFPFKDNIKKVEAQSLVVYKLSCKNCSAQYIGKTERILAHRIYEHQHGKSSACYQHVKSNANHKIDYENIEVIDRADSDNKLKIKELLHILKQEPSLNKQLNSQSSHEKKTLIIKPYPQFR